ncbi:MAG: hypothetical protein SWK76_15425 [Actinomycetota bacterium]|nr:hypothetical protein [Actinomycetota bacterium]
MAGEIGLLDVGEWQAWVDMESGRDLEEPGPGWRPVSDILAGRAYPGDLSSHGNAWVVDLALDAIDAFDPSLIILQLANQSFRAAFGGLSDSELGDDFAELKRQVDRFLREAPGYEPLIIGSGGFIPFKGYVDLMHLEGMAAVSGVSGHRCGLYRSTPEDLKLVSGIPQLFRLTSREDFRVEFGGCDAFYRRFPDYLVEMEKGWAVKCSLVMARHPARLGRSDGNVPVRTDLGEVKALEDIRPLVEKVVAAGRKVAVILGEGWSVDDFPYPCESCASRMGWFEYDLKSKVQVMFSGKPVVESEYPPTIRMYKEEDAYPFTVAFNEPSPDLLGRSVEGLSVAVGNRSILPHAFCGADITFECYARYIYNYGSMAILQGRGLEPLHA